MTQAAPFSTTSNPATARGLLLTLLGEFVLPDGGNAWTGQLIEALGLLGVEEKAARQAISRSAARGLLFSERIGRKTCWHLSEPGAKLLLEGAKRIYGLGSEDRRWDGRWALLIISVPESKRELRYRLRVRLGWAGFAPYSPGVWISPWVDRHEEAVAAVSELAVADISTSFVGNLQLGDARSIATRAWDLTDVRKQYTQFISSFDDVKPLSAEDAFVCLSRLVHEWRHFPNVDPGLPRELLPDDWDGHEAAELFTRLRSEWATAAQQWWHSRRDSIAASQ